MIKYEITYFTKSPFGRGVSLTSELFDTFEDALEFAKKMAFHFFRFELVVPTIVQNDGQIIESKKILLYNNISITDNTCELWNCFVMDKG